MRARSLDLCDLVLLDLFHIVGEREREREAVSRIGFGEVKIEREDVGNV